MGALSALPQPLADFLCVDVVWWGRGGRGFDLLGPEHLAVLALCAAAVALAVAAYKRLPEGCGKGSLRRRALLAVSSAELCSLALTNVLTALEGAYTAAKVPLYTCNLCEALDLADAVRPRRWLDASCLAMGVFGGACALVFCGWSGCPIWSVSSVAGFFEHSCIVAFPLMKVAGGDYAPRPSDALAPSLVTMADLAVAVPYNVAFGTNFMFVPDPHGVVPLQGIHDALGNPAYALLVVAVMCLSYFLVCRAASRTSARPGARGD